MRIRHIQILMASAAAMTLAACGGGGGGLSSTPYLPKPTPTPTPTPTPSPDATEPATPLTGVTQDTDFATVGSDVAIRWDAEAETYEVQLPDQQWAVLTPEKYGAYELVAGDAIVGRARLDSVTGYSYTGVLLSFDADGSTSYLTAFGIPTAPGDVPVTGTASFLGDLVGHQDGTSPGNGYSIFGSANFLFDFGAGTLAGSFNPQTADGWGFLYNLGEYSFVNTVYSAGSTSFSGGLHEPTNNLSGSFSGTFTGPAAAELMGNWKLEFVDPYNPPSPLNASGVVVAKKE